MAKKRKGKMIERSVQKKAKVPSLKLVIQEASELTLAKNRRLIDESGDEQEERQSEEEEKIPSDEEVSAYDRFFVKVSGKVLKKMTKFDDPKQVEECAARVSRGRMVKSEKMIDHLSLLDLGAEEEFVEYITGIGFEWLLDIQTNDVPVILAQEFFTSFKFKQTTSVMAKSISFRLFGRTLQMSLTEWSVRLGLYSEVQAEAGAWLDRDRGQPKAIEDFDPQAAWEAITTDAPPYKATVSRATNINRPVLRLAQVFLDYNLLGQANTSSSITIAELYIMRCMKEQRKVDLGYWLAHSCYQIAAHAV